jgi:hypothetical protein
VSGNPGAHFRGLLLDGDRKSIEPMAGRLAGINQPNEELWSGDPAVYQPEQLEGRAGSGQRAAA